MKIVETKTSAGLKYKGLLSSPKEGGDKIIIHIHGMGGSIVDNNFYLLMHEKYPLNTCAFLVGEHQGSGIVKSFERGNESVLLGNAFEKFEDCVEDIQAWINFALENGYQKIFLQAHSLGPAKLAYYLSQKDANNVEGVIWLSPSDAMGLVHTSTTIAEHRKLLAEAKELERAGRGEQLLSDKFWGEYLLSAQTYLNFFGEKANTAIFNYGNSALGLQIINNIRVPVLAITGTEDSGIKPVIDPKEAMRLLEAELKNSPRVKTIVYEGATHSFAGFEERIVDDVLEFIA